MNKRLLKKGLAGILTAAMVSGLFLGIRNKPVEAAKSSPPKSTGIRPVKDINLKDKKGNIPGITDPQRPANASSPWTGSKVYFGFDPSAAMGMCFRVLDANTTDYNQKPTMFLDSDRGVYINQYFCYDDSSNNWKSSNLSKWMNSTETTGFLKDWTELERKAIAYSTRSSSDGLGHGKDELGWCSIENEKVFSLDAKEATNPAYGYNDSADAAKERSKRRNSNKISWWLRSPSTSQTNQIGTIAVDGTISTKAVSEVSGDGMSGSLVASPAFNLDLERVLFASADPSYTVKQPNIDNNKYKAGDIKRPLDEDNPEKADVVEVKSTDYAEANEWKLTLLDESKKLTLGTGIQKGNTVTVPYEYKGGSGGGTTRNQISVMITDGEYDSETAMVLYYGQLDTGNDDLSANKTGTGTGSFTMPQNLPGTAKVYLLFEYLSGGNETDYASKPVQLHIHKWSSAWSSDSTHHWHECLAENCTVTDKSKKEGYGTHQANSGVVTKKPTSSQTGTKTYSCKTCGRVVRTETLPKLAPSPKPAKLVLKKPKVKSTTTYNSVKLSWKAVKGSGGYQVYRATKKNGKYKKVKTTKSKSWTNKKLTTGKSYYYKVRAYKKQSGKTVYGSFSKKVKAVPRTKAPKFTLKSGKRRIRVTWKKVKGAHGYRIYRAKSKGGKFNMIKDSHDYIPQYTSIRVFSNHKYYYKMRSYRIVKGKRVYSAYTKVKTVRTK